MIIVKKLVYGFSVIQAKKHAQIITLEKGVIFVQGHSGVFTLNIFQTFFLVFLLFILNR